MTEHETLTTEIKAAVSRLQPHEVEALAAHLERVGFHKTVDVSELTRWGYDLLRDRGRTLGEQPDGDWVLFDEACRLAAPLNVPGISGTQFRLALEMASEFIHRRPVASSDAKEAFMSDIIVNKMAMTIKDVAAPKEREWIPVRDTLLEIERAMKKFPTWPTDPLHAFAVIGEEHGELNQAILESVYEPGKSGPEDVRREAIHLAAMALRFIASLDKYEYRKGEQHTQLPPPPTTPAQTAKEWV